MSRIAQTFQARRARREGVLIPYLMAGDPDPERSFQYLRALVAGGADLIELGVPFSDPVADGPTIQAAGVRALRAGTTPETAFSLARRLRQESSVPLVLMTYYNPVFAVGEEAFLKGCREAGVDGLIVPDLPVEESGDLSERAAREGVDLICLATPETDNDRLARIASLSRGFLYLVSRYGVTGATETSPEAPLIQRARAAAQGLPVAVGFGLSSPEHVRAVLAAGADGAILGSALVAQVAEGASPASLEAYIQALKAATRPSSSSGSGPELGP